MQKNNQLMRSVVVQATPFTETYYVALNRFCQLQK
jgi:hypothetical protein